MQAFMIRTQRLKLRSWRDGHRAAFAEMHADPEVMADQGGPIDQTKSDAKLDRYSAALQSRHGEARAEHDLDVNVRAEREIEVILRHLENQNTMLIAMVQKLGIEPGLP